MFSFHVFVSSILVSRYELSVVEYPLQPQSCANNAGNPITRGLNWYLLFPGQFEITQHNTFILHEMRTEMFQDDVV